MQTSILKVFISVFFTIAILFTHASAQNGLPHVDLSVSFDLESHTVKGEATIIHPAGNNWTVHTGGLKITGATLDEKPFKPEAVEGSFVVIEGERLRLTFEGVFEGALGPAHTVDSTLTVGKGAINEEGVSLTGRWHPAVDGLAVYSLKALLPQGFEAISEAEEVTKTVFDGGVEFGFSFGHPRDGVSLAAGRYEVLEAVDEGVSISAYFFEEDAALAPTYMEYAARYIRMYSEMLGPYPFKRFSVVENFLPTGYSMPTYTLLGRAVVRLPFIVETSLGHEVLHQWFGNSVYGDYSEGNWLEGLTTYLADHYYDELKDEGWLYRKKIMADYQSYVTADKESALAEFSMRYDYASKSIGYGKGAIVFHMLRGMLGEKIFFRGLRSVYERYRFKPLGWSGIQKVFEDASDADLGWFFKQWLGRKGVAALEVRDPRLFYIEGKPTARFTLKQKSTDKGEPYRIGTTALFIFGDGSSEEKVIALNNAEQEFDFTLEREPVEMVIDADYDTMRSLSPAEYPPTVSRLMGDEKRIMVLPKEGVEPYAPLTEVFRGAGFEVKLQGELSDGDLSGASVLLLGSDGPYHRRMFASPTTNAEGRGLTFEVMANPLDTSRVVAVAWASSKEEALAAAKVFRYGKYSRLRFEGGKNVLKEISPSARGMRFSLKHSVSGVRPEAAVDLDEIIRDVIDKKVIFIGESHTKYEDHKVQLAVIRALHESGRSFAVGMEMFQRPFQNAVDSYIEGRTEEAEFLKDTEYFKRWRFDYHLYREIVAYLKEHGIPLIALNADSNVIRKVSKGGLDALNEEERSKIPADMDMADDEYRSHLKEVFGLHGNAESRKFLDFYQSQIIWDETMAHTVAGYLAEHPESQMVVLAGMGHIAYGQGIPKRVSRIGGHDYAILINSNIGIIEPGMADYVLFPEPLEALKTPSIGILVMPSKEGILVDRFPPRSPAKKAGMKKGDIVTAVDGVTVKSLEDLKVALLYKKSGDVVKVRLLRKRFLLGRKEMELPVKLK